MSFFFSGQLKGGQQVSAGTLQSLSVLHYSSYFAQALLGTPSLLPSATLLLFFTSSLPTLPSPLLRLMLLC